MSGGNGRNRGEELEVSPLSSFQPHLSLATHDDAQAVSSDVIWDYEEKPFYHFQLFLLKYGFPPFTRTAYSATPLGLI